MDEIENKIEKNEISTSKNFDQCQAKIQAVQDNNEHPWWLIVALLGYKTL